MQGPTGAGAPHVETDDALVELWLRGRRPSRRADDRAIVERFLAFVGMPLRQVTARELQACEEPLSDRTPEPRARVHSTVVSLLRLGRRVGYLRDGRRSPPTTPPRR